MLLRSKKMSAIYGEGTVNDLCHKWFPKFYAGELNDTL